LLANSLFICGGAEKKFFAFCVKSMRRGAVNYVSRAGGNTSSLGRRPRRFLKRCDSQTGKKPTRFSRRSDCGFGKRRPAVNEPEALPSQRKKVKKKLRRRLTSLTSAAKFYVCYCLEFSAKN
jgi:hypothetical protein